jgi:hypothetical protein
MSAAHLDAAFPAHRRGKNRARQLTAPERSLYLWILQQFAGGEPPAAADTKERAMQKGLDFGAATASLARDDLVHLGPDGRPLIAYPFSAVSRGHTVTLSHARKVEAMCALDALGIAAMLGETSSAAADALTRGDPDPFAALFAEDAEWRGLARSSLVEARALLTRPRRGP